MDDFHKDPTKGKQQILIKDLCLYLYKPLFILINDIMCHIQW
ncbi:hypothetical protein Gotur_025700 [Gossypium turneri]